MPVTYISGGSGSRVGPGSFSVSLGYAPSPRQPGDVMVMAVALRARNPGPPGPATTNLTTPAGWTEVVAPSSVDYPSGSPPTNVVGHLFVKEWQGETSPITLSTTSPNYVIGAMVTVLRGVWADAVGVGFTGTVAPSNPPIPVGYDPLGWPPALAGRRSVFVWAKVATVFGSGEGGLPAGSRTVFTNPALGYEPHLVTAAVRYTVNPDAPGEPSPATLTAGPQILYHLRLPADPPGPTTRGIYVGQVVLGSGQGIG